MNYCMRCGKEIAKTNAKYCAECRRLISSETMSATNHKYASERMKTNNPMFYDNIRIKMSNTLKRINHKPKIRGGNGAETPKPVLFVYEKLSNFSPKLEYCISTKNNPLSIKTPYNYKIDIAIPEIKIAIEVDGESHSTILRKDADKRKTEYLQSVGWNVFRIKNKDVKIFDYEVIYNAIKRLSTAIL